MTTPLDWAAAKVAKAAGFSQAHEIVELGAGDFSRSVALAERHPDKHFLSTDYLFSEAAEAQRPNAETIANLDIAKLDARTLDLPAESIDFLFSVALMEHIAELPECLDAAYRALRPGGTYFYIQAPFWSCAQGHHFHHSLDSTYDFIPKYSHLTWEPDEMRSHLAQGPPPPFEIDAAVERIYERPDLSRLGCSATKQLVGSSRFDLAGWTETPDRRYDERRADEAFPRIRKHAMTRAEMSVSGAEVALRKPSEVSRPRATRTIVRRVGTVARRLRSRLDPARGGRGQ